MRVTRQFDEPIAAPVPILAVVAKSPSLNSRMDLIAARLAEERESLAATNESAGYHADARRIREGGGGCDRPCTCHDLDRRRRLHAGLPMRCRQAAPESAREAAADPAGGQWGGETGLDHHIGTIEQTKCFLERFRHKERYK